MMSEPEVTDTFDCFGSTCAILLSADGREPSAWAALALARRRLESWHERFSRFSPDSELSRLNSDPRQRVTVSRMMAGIAAATRMAGAMSDGLVDATLIDRLEQAGYTSDLPAGIPLSLAIELAPPRRPATAAVSPGWRKIDVDVARGLVTRPPGVGIDSGGIAKGLFADVLAGTLAGRGSFAVNCAGDLSIGGRDGVGRPVKVESPFDGSTLHTFSLTRAGIATSGIGRRSWLDPSGLPAHHLLDPSSGRPAFTGIVQATAIAPTALVAEIRAKAALLSGPVAAAAWLGDGGVIVLDDGSHRVFEPSSSTQQTPSGDPGRSEPAGRS
jgi:thiamine biosynthesis lipoprotein